MSLNGITGSTETPVRLPRPSVLALARRREKEARDEAAVRRARHSPDHKICVQLCFIEAFGDRLDAPA